MTLLNTQVTGMLPHGFQPAVSPSAGEPPPPTTLSREVAACKQPQSGRLPLGSDESSRTYPASQSVPFSCRSRAAMPMTDVLAAGDISKAVAAFAGKRSYAVCMLEWH